jgi:hypothetical protein
MTHQFIKDKPDLEVSMFQLDILPNLRPENYICRGLNQKMNYFVDKYHIWDLEFNIPI